MEKGILLIACLLVLLGCASCVSTDKENDPEMEVLVNNISELASKVLDIFEPLAAKATNDSMDDPENTYFVSFLLRDRKNKTAKHEAENVKQRMVVNNNFSGEKMGTNQVYLESGTPPKQPPSHNIQLMNNAMNPQGYQDQNFEQPYQQIPHQQYPQQPQQIGSG